MPQLSKKHTDSQSTHDIIHAYNETSLLINLEDEFVKELSTCNEDRRKELEEILLSAITVCILAIKKSIPNFERT